MKDQFDRSLLRAISRIPSVETNPRATDKALLAATEPQLRDALICLKESEFRELEPLNLDHKLRTLLDQKWVAEQRLRYWAPLIVGILAVLVGLGSLLLASFR